MLSFKYSSVLGGLALLGLVFPARAQFIEHTVAGGDHATVGAYWVHAADVDGDGDLDILSASKYDDRIAWRENDGQGNFIPHTISLHAHGARSVYAIDVDGDGDMDVLSASREDDDISWYENDGNEHFTEHTVSDLADGAYDVYAVRLAL